MKQEFECMVLNLNGTMIRLNPRQFDVIIKYKEHCEATEKAYEELKRDVKRYWEVKTSFKDIKEYELLKEKLQKVGNE